jgi:hypothetical protein
LNLFGKIWIQNVRDIDLKVISAAENSNKFQKIRFWKEKSIENVVPLGPTAQATLVNERSSHSLIPPPFTPLWQVHSSNQQKQLK